MSAYQLPPWVWPTAVISAGALSLVRGRDEERVAAFTMLASWAVTMVVYRADNHGTQWGILLVDLAQLGVFLWLAAKSRRYWPLFVAAFGLLQVLTHGAKTLDTGISAWAYITAQIIWSYLIVFAIVYASWTAPHRYAEIGDPMAVPDGPRGND